MSESPANLLGKEIGAGPLKLPVWMWGVAIVGGIFIARKVGAFGAGGALSADNTPTTDNSASLGMLGANGAVPVAAGGAFSSPDATSITDNDMWRKAAVNYLISAGYDSLVAARSIDKYLNGEVLNPIDNVLVEAAIRRLGPTPQPVTPPLGGGNTPPPKPKPVQEHITTPPVQQVTPKYRGNLKPGHNAFEIFVGFCNSQDGHSTWWLTNLGGVYTFGDSHAKYWGSPGGSGDHRTNWNRIITRYPKDGYTCVTNDGFSRNYGPT